MVINLFVSVEICRFMLSFKLTCFRILYYAIQLNVLYDPPRAVKSMCLDLQHHMGN